MSQKKDRLHRTLGDILDGHGDESLGNALDQVANAYSNDGNDSDSDDADMGSSAKRPPTGFCIECEDQPAFFSCEQCADDFCEVCYTAQHRKGSRKMHKAKRLGPEPKRSTSGDKKADSSQNADDDSESDEVMADSGVSVYTSDRKLPKGYFLERSKYIPLRLTYEERKYLRLLEAALNVSEYTDRIDILSYSNKSRRIVGQIKELCSILSGLVMAADYKTGQELFENRAFEENAEFYQKIFELGRRHKIMNPEKMRATYGKLVYMLQDSQIPEVKEILQFDCVTDIKSVYAHLSAHDGLALLEDDLINIATMEIVPEGKLRHQIQNEIKQKERAIEVLARKYARGDLTADGIKQCLYSIGDNHAFLRTNRDPCEKMIAYLKEYFDPENWENGLSLAISSGRGGARLSHDHSKQYQYVLQSLTLWREILHDMFMLWCLSEDDLLSESNPYRLRDTGQGLNRVQAAPRVSRTMHMILNRAQQRVERWIGSSVIHLGDHNVPNALMFIDKYTQVYRILLPIVNALEHIDEVASHRGLDKYIQETFKGPERLKKEILCDFFRHAFDGSGADNFFDAGSCIDGRLTSAWNWCSKLEKKPYFHVFLLTGFVGFDGRFE
ncbi:uncharacterized protein BJ171DRAFT_442325 [Polychytrium aggregatum]|uniref:uncharacterized protein n=1 Tax=Polychytrium aggregatum TaxID=110093 RepID=UPI0022FE8C49|nr:uncharacterized protein BJ171DRAFT_442325 [Polychytrium aggregatum]KAI9204659.1 hypothetical protein BJ171DRAFT_442325 [Polychytrium aggregatum]